MNDNLDGLPPRLAERFAALNAGQRVTTAWGPAGVVTEVSGDYCMVRLDTDEPGWPSIAYQSCELQPVCPVPLVYTFESFDSEGELTESTSKLGPLDVLAELHICEGLSEDGARSVFPVLSAPGVVTVSMPGGWSFRLTSEEER